MMILMIIKNETLEFVSIWTKNVKIYPFLHIFQYIFPNPAKPCPPKNGRGLSGPRFNYEEGGGNTFLEPLDRF